MSSIVTRCPICSNMSKLPVEDHHGRTVVLPLLSLYKCRSNGSLHTRRFDHYSGTPIFTLTSQESSLNCKYYIGSTMIYIGSCTDGISHFVLIILQIGSWLLLMESCQYCAFYHSTLGCH